MGSSVDFLIDIKQRSSGNAITELDRLTSELDQATAKYKQLETAATNAQKRLEAHGSKLGAAKSDLSNAVIARDAGAVNRAAAQIQKLTAEEDRLKSHASQAAAAMQKQASVVSSLSDKVGAMRKHEISMKDAEHAADTLGQRSKKLGNALGGLPGPLGVIGQRAGNAIDDFMDLKEGFGKTAAVAVVTSFAFVALATALTLAAGKALYFGIVQASAARDFALTVQAVTEGNDKIGSSFHSIGNETGVANDRLLDITRALEKAKVASSQIPDALRALAEQEAALGDSGGTQELIDKLKTGQTTVDQLSKDMDAKFGAIVEKKMLGLSQQTERLKNNFANLFTSLNLEPFLKGFKTLVDLFDSDTAAGRQMQETFRSIFQPLLDGATSAIPLVRRALLYVELGIVNVEVALDPLATHIRDSFETGPLGDFAAALGGTDGTLWALDATFSGFATTLDVVFTNLNLVLGAVDALTSGLGGLKSVTQAAMGPLGQLGASASSSTGSLPGDMQGVGENASAGLASGITAGQGAVIGAVTSMAGGAVGAAVSAFNIHSPSKVFEGIGLQNAAGLAIGHEKGANDVEQSIETMTTIPSLKPGKASGGGRSVVFSDGAIRINITGGDDADELAAKAREAVRAALEDAGLELGADIFGDEEDAAA